jgi:hypothetical protein
MYNFNDCTWLQDAHSYILRRRSKTVTYYFLFTVFSFFRILKLNFEIQIWVKCPLLTKTCWWNVVNVVGFIFTLEITGNNYKS